MKPSLKINKQTRILLLILMLIALLAFTAAYLYYGYQNRSEDPRIVDTKRMLKAYDAMMADKQYEESLLLLDSVEAVLNRVPGYSSSFERGIVYNNRGSVYLSQALYEVTDSLDKQGLLNAAAINLDSGIVIYKTWLGRYGSLSRQELTELTKTDFPAGDPALQKKDIDILIQKRVDDLVMAQKEAPRRLSVCFTNLGIVLRHQYQQEKAIQCYVEAIRLWKENHTARNNLNVLMGRPPKDRNIIEQLFPPDKNKF